MLVALYLRIAPCYGRHMDQEHNLKRWLRMNNKPAKWLAKQIGVTPEHLSRIMSDEPSNIKRANAMAIQLVTDGGVTLQDWGLDQ